MARQRYGRKFDDSRDDYVGPLYMRRYYREMEGTPHVLPGVDDRCDICGIREDISTPLVVDHCHKTGAFRGWLCAQHNRAIGLLGDDAEGVGAALAYLGKA